MSFFESLAPLVLKIGKEILSNEKIQASAKELGQKGIEEIISSINEQ